MLKNQKITYTQSLGLYKITVWALRGVEALERFEITPYEATENTYAGFGVTSDSGLDTFGNGYHITTIEEAIRYIKYHVKNNY